MAIENNGLIGSFEVNKRTISFPAYFPQISRKYDISDLLNVITKLEQQKIQNPLHNLRGIFVEVQKCKLLEDDILTNRNQQRLFDRSKGSKFATFFDFRNEYSIPFFIDPNLDRLTTGGYIDEFKAMKEKIFTKDFDPFIKNDNRNINPAWLLNPDFIRRLFEYQIHFNVDELIAPYTVLDYRKIASDLNLNRQLYTKAVDLAKTIFNRSTKPLLVVSLKGNILRARTDKTGKNPVWDAILAFVNEANPLFVIVKLSEFNTASKDENYEGICSFFKYFRQRVGEKPIILLNMNEFAYVLFGEGLQVYSAMMSRSGKESGGGQQLPDTDFKELPFGKYYVPRTMELAKRDSLKKLNCGCLMCKPSVSTFKNLDVAGWNTLRIGHFLITKNSEVECLKTEIKKNSMRAALKDMFADSKNWKNFTGFC